MAESKLVMLVDTKRCIACNSCAVACKVENNLPKDIWWNRVMTVGGPHMDAPAGTYPNLEMYNVTVACQHCENPACVKVCPVGATYKDPETGVVRQDYDKCIGCRMCMSACPYNGVRSFNWENPAITSISPLAIKTWRRIRSTWWRSARSAGTALRRGWRRRCVEVCSARARIFGDANDPDSEVSQKLRERSSMRLLEDRETEPSVYFLV